MELQFRRCTAVDLCVLRNLSIKTYLDTFGEMNTPSNMKSYLDEAYSEYKLSNELENKNSDYLFLYSDSELTGYIKLNESDAQTDIHDSQSLEIERIYLTKEYPGRGLGKSLLNKGIEIAVSRKKTYIWLGVWEKNEKAILFYKLKWYKDRRHEKPCLLSFVVY